MLWAYYTPCEPKPLSTWDDIYVFNREEERDVDSPSYVLTLTAFKADEKFEVSDADIIAGIATNGYFWDEEESELFFYGAYNEKEFLQWLKIAITQFSGDEDPQLSPGTEEEFVGTNQDSIMIIKAKQLAAEVEECEARGEVHPDIVPFNLDELKEDDRGKS